MNEAKKENVCLFAGTTEGRRLAGLLKDSVRLTVCVATEYGEVVLDNLDGIDVHTGRMDEEQMEGFLRKRSIDRVIDATHPFAQIASQNIAKASESCGIPNMRILRDVDSHIDGAVYVSSVKEASAFLSNVDGNVLITTGAKELSSYSNLDSSRIWARVLPLPSSLEACEKAGIQVSHIIAAQGPFSYEMNLAQMKMIGARYLVTKESGQSGGFEEKLKAAQDAGAVAVVVGQPPQGSGCTFEQAARALSDIYGLKARKIYLIGIGPGSTDSLTCEALKALEECDAVIGARNVTSALSTGKPTYDAFLPDGVRKVLEDHPSIRTAAIVMRGDVGFYSGARRMIDEFGLENLSILPGIASPVAFAAKLGISWEDAALVSLHGRDFNLIHTVNTTRKTIALTGGDQGAAEICRRLCDYGLGDLQVTVGERLSYPDERITSAKASQLSEKKIDPLSVMLIENPNADRGRHLGIADDMFIRSDVPMTKAEVRCISVAALCLKADSVVWDIGAGTGSVSIECALSAHEGTVYAIEKDPDAASLIRRNAIRFRTENIKVVEGLAPDVLKGLPTPTHAFVGGSSGNMRDIMAALLERNPDVRIVVNTVTLESQNEAFECAREFGFDTMDAVTVNISRSRAVGRYHMMSAQNPVTVFVMQGGKTLA